MILWLVIGLIAVGSLIALAWPLFAAPKERLSPSETDYLAAQLDDVDRERAIGALNESEAETARLEAKRRLLAAGRTRKEAGATGNAAAIVRRAALMGVGAIPLAAIALYLDIGAPDRNSTSARSAAAQTSGADERPVADLIAGLEERLAANPDDVEGWMTLGESHAAFGRYDDAADAFARASEIDPGSAFIHAAFAEALILAAGGAVTEEADAALAQALTLDPNEPRARFYQAQGLYQAGDKDGALRMMTALVNEAPDDAPWLAIAHNQLVSMAMETGEPLRAAGLSEAAEARLKQQMEQEVAAAEAAPAPPGDPAALEAKVASGAAHYTEWLQLAERHAAAGDAAKAADVLASARERYAAAPFVLQQIARTEARLTSEASASPRRGPTAEQVEAAQAMSPQDKEAMIEGMVSSLAARLKTEPNDPDGWMMLGRSYGVLGDLGKSADAFSQAAALKPEDIAVQLSYAQALLAMAEAANAPIDRETEKVLEGVLRRDPDQIFALYYLGLAAQQRQDKKAAKRHWEKLAALLPEGSEDAKRIGALLQSLNQPPRP